jgi:hypothetical protein
MTDELEAIRARHEDTSGGWMQGHCDIEDGEQVHTDRATLLAHVDRLVAELAEIGAWTDDDQRGLNAAVADAMWHWDTRNEGPLDPDDAISLAESLKFHLKDNGFQIVRLATRAQGESS